MLLNRIPITKSGEPTGKQRFRVGQLNERLAQKSFGLNTAVGASRVD
jgi:hypothetical protein